MYLVYEGEAKIPRRVRNFDLLLLLYIYNLVVVVGSSSASPCVLLLSCVPLVFGEGGQGICVEE